MSRRWFYFITGIALLSTAPFFIGLFSHSAEAQGAQYTLSNSYVTYSFYTTINNFYLSSIFDSQSTFSFQAADLFEVTLRDPENGSEIVLSPSSVPPQSVDVKKVTSSSGSALHATYIFLYGGATFEVVATIDLKNSDRLASWKISVTPSGSTRSILKVAFPRVLIKPLGSASDDMLAMPYNQGAAVVNPPSTLNLAKPFTFVYAGGLPSGGHLGYPASLQFYAYDDPSTPSVLYLATHDSAGYLKNYEIKGTGSATRFSFVHIPRSNLLPNRKFSQPYAVYVGPLQGTWYDAAKYYRSWAIQQPWASSGKLRDSSRRLSTALGDAEAFSVFTPQPWKESYVEEDFEKLRRGLNQWKNLLGISRTAGYWYGIQRIESGEWFPYVYLWDTAASTLRAMAGNNDFVARYWRPNIWPYDTPSYYENKIEDQAIKCDPNLVLYDSPNNSCDPNIDLYIEPYDPAHETPVVHINPVMSASRQLHYGRIREEINTTPTYGFYFDVWSSENFADQKTSHYPYIGGGNYWLSGMYTQAAEIRDIGRARRSNFFLGTEYMQEPYLGVMDFSLWNFNGMNIGLYNGADFPGVTLLPIFSTVYHDYSIAASTGGTGNAPVTEANIGLLPVGYYYLGLLLHNGALITINGSGNEAEGFSPFPPGDSVPEAQPLFQYMRYLVRTYSRHMDFLKFGERLRDPSAAISSIDHSDIGPVGAFADLYWPSYPRLPKMFPSLWRNANGEVLLLLINWNSDTISYEPQLSFASLGLSPPLGVYRSVNDGDEVFFTEERGSTFGQILNVPGHSVYAYRFTKDYSLPPTPSSTPSPSISPTPTPSASPPPPPAAPSGLYLTNISADRITLNWTDNAANETGFLIQRKVEAGSFSDLERIDQPDSRAYNDTSVEPNTIYTYRIAAYNAGGISDFSNDASATTIGSTPSAAPTPSPRIDTDKDGYYSLPSGGNDCNDSNPNINPGAPELCDGLDNDCDRAIDEQCTVPATDADRDRYVASSAGGDDCDDSDPNVHPAAQEICSDSIDNNCDGTVDDGCVCTSGETRPCQLQAGVCAGALEVCFENVWSGCTQGLYKSYSPAYEPNEQSCDNLDNNCDGVIDEGCPTIDERCTDGVQNYGEDGVDCGGACPNDCHAPASPSERKSTSLLFIIVAIVLGAAALIVGVYRVRPR